MIKIIFVFSWLYHCEDIAAIAKTRNSDPDHRIDSAKIFRKETDLFIDSVRLTRDGEKDAGQLILLLL